VESHEKEALLVRWLQEATRVLAFCGAGVSAESGVPTFRGAGGLWEGHRIEDVATPEAFERDPVTVWRFYAERLEKLETVHPNPAHLALAEMEGRCREFLLVTQNVDDLHERAGSRKLIKLHGSIKEVRCTACGRIGPLPAGFSFEAVKGGEMPRCGCGGLLRPNVVWFGEYLDPEHFQRLEGFFRSCPLPDHPTPQHPNTPTPQHPNTPTPHPILLIIGTSGLVSGGYGVTWLAKRYGAKVVEINPEASALSLDVDLALRMPAGEVMRRVWPLVKAVV